MSVFNPCPPSPFYFFASWSIIRRWKLDVQCSFFILPVSPSPRLLVPMSVFNPRPPFPFYFFASWSIIRRWKLGVQCSFFILPVSPSPRLLVSMSVFNPRPQFPESPPPSSALSPPFCIRQLFCRRIVTAIEKAIGRQALPI